MIKKRLNKLLILSIVALYFTACRDKTGNIESPKYFTHLSEERSGFQFINAINETVELNYFSYNYLYNGSGVSIGDINNDGLPDIYMVGTLVPNKLFLNKGNLEFEDITHKAGVGAEGTGGICSGATMADINNDGFLDIYVCKSGPFEKLDHTSNLLYINRGDNTFDEKAFEYGLRDYGFSSMASFFDYNQDGFLDMYLLSHRINFKYTIDELINNRNKRDKEASDKLFQNNGNGTFTDVSDEVGLCGDYYGYGLGVSTADLSGDGWPDIYVSNDFSGEDYYYVNNQDGSFKQEILNSFKHISNNGMGCDIADFNNDGYPDLIQVDMTAKDHYRQKTNMGAMNPEQFYKLAENDLHHQYMLNSLQLNNGNGSFSEIAQFSGVAATDWSWASIFADLDNDGWKDLFITNGLKRDMRNSDMLKTQNPNYVNGFVDGNVLNALKKIPSVKISNPIFKNNKDLSFTEVTTDWGGDIPMNSNGASIADLDLDGDLDIVVNNVDDPSAIFENNATKINNNHFLKIRIRGKKENPFGLGTKLTIRTGNDIQYQELQNARGYQSSSEYTVHFGLGDKTIVEEMNIEWYDGNRSTIKNIPSDQILFLDYNIIEREGDETNEAAPTIFTEITSIVNVNYRHIENKFDDFNRESLLPHKMSTNGPAAAIGDVNNDGFDDVFAGGAVGQAGELYLQNSDGKFIKSHQQTWQKNQLSEDMGVLFFDADNDKDLDLYVCSGGNEHDQNNLALKDRLYLNNGNGGFTQSPEALPEIMTSTSCVIGEDYDKDGDIDLFVGGRQVPGKYPFSPRSYILNNENGIFTDVTKEIAPDLTSPGMVTQAIWSDFDADGFVDLVVVGEWMPVSFYKNNDGYFENVNTIAGMDKSNGMWFSLEQADFDNDGDMDYVAGNLGLNSKYKASLESPFEIFCDDFDSNGTLDIVLSTFENGVCFPVRGRGCSSAQMPFINKKFPSFDDFAKADIQTVYGSEKLQNALHHEIYTLATSFIENKGNGQFDLIELPNTVQLSTVFGILADDYNKDGHKDLLISGNFYAPEIETTRYDASIGALLLGDGKNNFRHVPSGESGFYTPGEVRGLFPIKLSSNQNGGIIVVNNNDKMQVFSLNN